MNTLERIKKNLYFDAYQRDKDAVCMVRITDVEKLLAVVEASKIVLVEAYYERGPNKVWEECHEDLKKALAALEEPES